jgi:hypothetical protein
LIKITYPDFGPCAPKINESSDADNKWETYFYDKINNRGNDGTYRLKINIQNDLVTSFQIR